MFPARGASGWPAHLRLAMSPRGGRGVCEPRNTDLRAVGDLQRRVVALVGRGWCDFCLCLTAGLAADGRLKTFCHYVRPVFRVFRVIPLPHIQGFVQTRCLIFFLALQSRIVWGQEIVFLEVLTEITGSVGNRPFGPKTKSMGYRTGRGRLREHIRIPRAAVNDSFEDHWPKTYAHIPAYFQLFCTCACISTVSIL